MQQRIQYTHISLHVIFRWLLNRGWDNVPQKQAKKLSKFQVSADYILDAPLLAACSRSSLSMLRLPKKKKRTQAER